MNQKNNDITITIIMPTLNAAEFIEDALFSLKNQTFSNYELVVCDKSSTDGTLRCIEDQGLANVKIINIEEAGVPLALNKGFDAALGDYVCWLNADDVLASRNSLKFVEKAFQNNDVDVVIGDHYIINETGCMHNYHVYCEEMADYRLTNIFTGSLFFKREVWVEFGGFSNNSKYSFEYELIKFIHDRKKNIVACNIALSALRIHKNTLTNLNSLKMNDEAMMIQNDMPKKNVSKLSAVMTGYSLKSFFKALVIKIIFKIYGPNWREIYRF